MTAAELLRELREQRGKSVRGAAADLGLTPSFLSRLERGERGFGAEVSSRIANYYGVTTDLLALAEGRVPHDVLLILREHPEEIEALREKYRNTDNDE